MEYLYGDMKLKYTIPSYYLDGSKTKEDQVKTTIIPLKTICISIVKYLNKLTTEYGAVTTDPTQFKWNMFNELQMPEYAYISEFEKESMYPGSFTKSIRTVFSVLNKLNTQPYNNYLRSKQTNYEFLMVGHQFQVFWDVSIGYTDYLTPYAHKDEPSKKMYKIHLTPKHEYFLYTIWRFFMLLHKYPAVFHNKKIRGKVLLNIRTSKPFEENTQLVFINGGATPMIVMYMDDNNDFVRTVLDILLEEFKNDIPIIGGMTVDYKYRVLPFNVRLNSLISYAQGDRSKKLDAREAFEKVKATKTYFMPSWLKEIKDTACESSKQENEILTMQLFGKNICSAENQAMLSNENCLDDVCWLTAYPNDMLDPRSIPHFTVETASQPTIAEANTTANNTVATATANATTTTANATTTTANATTTTANATTTTANTTTATAPSANTAPTTNTAPTVAKEGGRRMRKHRKTRKTRRHKRKTRRNK
jgi:hypothetical protein